MVKKERLRSRVSFRAIVKPYRKQVVLLSVLTVLLSLLQVTMALLSRFVIDAALVGTDKIVFWGVLLAVNVAALVGSHTLLVWCANSVSDRLSASLRQDILCSAVYSRDEKLRDQHSGELLSRGIEDVYTVCDGAVNTLPTWIGQVTRLTATFAAILFINPMVAAVLAVIAVVVGGATACLRPVMKQKHRVVRETDEQVMATMQEDLQQLELIQSLDAQEQILSRFEARQQENLRMRFRRRLWTTGSNGIINAASQIGSGLLLLWGAAGVAKGTMSYGSLTAMLQLLALFRGPVLGLSGLWTRLAAVEVAAERLRDLLKKPEKTEALKKQPVVHTVVFEDVTFTYPGEENPVLRNFSLQIPVTDWSCLTGASGKGKTTLFKLILGLLHPQQGRIYLQTTDGNFTCDEQTRQLFAYVPQDYTLLTGTILDNLRLVAPDVQESQLRQALSVANADFVWELSSKEQAQLRENNAGLSKGQLQRLAIARAILMERPIFLLDECTSALDSVTEKTVLQNLRKLGKQAILVTHRPEALGDLGDITPVSMVQ